MSFKDERFEFVANIVDAAPVANAIVGGAVRDERYGRAIKDFDIVVHSEDAQDLLVYLEDCGFKVSESMDHVYEASEDNHFVSTYSDWYRLGLEHQEFGDFTIDMLVLRRDIYKREQGVAPSRNFKIVVSGFDNTMNCCLYYAGTMLYLSDVSDKLAIQLKAVTQARVEHLQEIAQDIGWTYVPLAK